MKADPCRLALVCGHAKYGVASYGEVLAKAGAAAAAAAMGLAKVKGLQTATVAAAAASHVLDRVIIEYRRVFP